MSEEPKIKKPFYKKWWAWLIALLIIGIIFVPKNTDNSTKTAVNTETTKEIPKEKESGITLANFKKLETGMRLSAVQKLLNSEGELQTSAGEGEYKIEYYLFKGGLMEVITVGFQGGKLTSKSQIGLK